MKKIIEFSANHPVCVLMYFSLAMILGVIGAFFVKKSHLPQTKDRALLVSAEYQGVKAREIKKLVAIPLEENLAALKNAQNIESVSRDGICVIKITLKWSSNIDEALLETNAILDCAMEFLPDDCSRPQAKIIGSESACARICVLPKNKDLCAASDFVQNELKTKILSLKECSSVEVFGAQKREIKAIVDSDKAAFYNLSLGQIAQALNLSNYDYPAGTIKEGDYDLLLKTEGSFKSFYDMEETIIKKGDGLLKLKDIAKIESGVAKTDSFYLCNGERCVAIDAHCKKKQDPLSFVKQIKEICDEINSKDGNYDIVLESDSSKEISQALKNLIASALVGVACAFLLTMIFFKSLKTALLIASSIPLSALFCVFVLFCFNKSVNIISLTGITLCLGMIIDNNIVAMESLMEKSTEKNIQEKIINSIDKIALSNSASTVTTIIVFVPVFFIGGIFSEVFSDLGIMVMAGMFFSLAFSFTVLPAVCSLSWTEKDFCAMRLDLRCIEARYDKILLKTNRIRNLCPIVTAACFLLA